MSESKKTTNGAAWIRRGALATAATAMALTSLLAAPSAVSAAPRDKGADSTISVDDTTVPTPVDETKNVGKKIKDPIFSMMGGGWA